MITFESKIVPNDIRSVTFVIAYFMSANFFSLALTHENVPDYPPLPDVVLDNVKYQVSQRILSYLYFKTHSSSMISTKIN
jgi:hypothetical protein